MKALPWIIIVILLLFLGGMIFFWDSSADYSVIKHKLDSAGLAATDLRARLIDLESRRSSDRIKFDSLKTQATAKSESLKKEVTTARQNTKVVEIIRTVPEVATAFASDDKYIAWQSFRIAELENLDSAHVISDSLYAAKRDSIEANMAFITNIYKAENSDLKKDLKSARSPIKLGISAGVGSVVANGQIYAGPGIQIGISYTIPFNF